MLNLKKILSICISLPILLPTIIGISSCSHDKHVSYKANGTNWDGIEKGHFDESDYQIDEQNKTITYINGDKIMSTNLKIPDFVNVNGSDYAVYLGKKCFYKNTLLKGDVQLNKFTREIPDQCFHSCISLNSVTCSVNVQKVGYQAFYECLGLQYINAENGFFYFLESIGEEAFYRCQLKRLELLLGPNLTSLGKRAFFGCWDVRNISLLNAINISSIPDGCFSGCNQSKYLILSKTINQIGDEAFLACTELVQVLLPENNMYLSLGNNTFQACSKLTGFSNKCTLKSIGKQCFSSCYALENINDIIATDDPLGLKSIPSNTFNSCKNITYLKLPKNIGVVYDEAFANCANLTTIDVSVYDSEEKIVQFSGTTVFANCGETGNILYNINTNLNNWKQIFSNAGLNISIGGWSFTPVEI